MGYSSSQARSDYMRKYRATKRAGQTWIKKCLPFTPDDDAFLAEHYGEMKVRDIADHLQRTPASIYSRARDIGLRDETRYAREDTFIFTRAWYLKNQRIFKRAMTEALQSGEF